MEIFRLLLVCSVAAAAFGNVDQTHLEGSKFKSKYFEPGDPRYCREVDRDTKFPVTKFEVLPGVGWDNLQNVAKGQVIDFSYFKCQSTDDSRFLVPDQVFTIPIKESYVDTFAELIDSWHNTSSTTANSVNVNAGLHIGFASISGSYSSEHTQIKKKQIEDKAVTVRVQLRYHRYMSQLQPDSSLHITFKRRLLNIAAFVELNDTQNAYYEGELLIRDFGTHVINSITAGAGLMKTDFLKRDYVASQSIDKTKVLVSASASFGSFFGASGSYGHITENDDYKSYLKSQTHSFVTTHGGPMIKAFNTSLSNWTRDVDMELVPMDRSGDPLSFLVTEQTLPELPLELVYGVEEVVRKSIIQYYEKNTIHGCTKMGSPNFSFSANFDDGSCGAAATNMTFGGVYQTCNVEGQFINNNPCNGLNEVNPKTRTYACPAHYTAVQLVTGRKTGKPETRRECHSCGFLGLFDCCDNHQYVATAVFTTYWCAGLGQVPQNSGYLFGGIYSSSQDNVFTGTKGCPPTFYPRVFLDHQICISDDFEVGTQYSIPFGGFVSCTMGDPLAMPNVKPVSSAPKENSLRAFMEDENNPSTWPKHCPHGYSQHLVTIENGCEIRYCLKAGSLSGPNLPHIKLPPYREKPGMRVKVESRVMFSKKTHEWASNSHQYKELFPASKTSWEKIWASKDDSNAMTPAGAAVIAVVVTLGCGMVAMVAYRVVQRRRQNSTRTLKSEEVQKLIGENSGTFGEIPVETATGYGSVSIGTPPPVGSCAVVNIQQ